MKKIIIMLTLVMGVVATSFGQGDCFSSATNIGTCGYFYGGNNATFGACNGDMCGCVGGGTNPSNLDDDCSTTYSGGNCGSDFQGSIENSMFWYFTPTESCDWELCITADNCCCASGPGPDFMQVWIGQRDTTTGLITAYHVNDNSNTSITGGNTVCYTFSVDINDGDLVVMTDGNAGSECDIYLDLNQVNCSDTCPVAAMSVDWFSISAKNTGTYNIITWEVAQDGTAAYNVQRGITGEDFKTIGFVRPKEDGTHKYSYTDNQPEAGANYYRIEEVDEDGTISYSKVTTTFIKFEDLYGDVIKRYDLMGNEVDDDDYRGVVIGYYSSGRYRKMIKE